MDNYEIVGMLVVVAIIMAMAVGVVFGMSLKRVTWFFTAAFAVLTVLMFRAHWAGGVATLIVGIGGVATLIGVMRLVERDKRASAAKTTI